MNVLTIDVGGSNVKCLSQGQDLPRKFPSGKALTPQRFIEGVNKTVADWDFGAVTIGFPAPVGREGLQMEPVNLAPGWLGFDFSAALGKPVKLINDAAMQALGSYQGGRMLFIGLGTGLGSAMVADHVVIPLELAHLPYRKGRTFEDYVGQRGLDRWGPKRWNQSVFDTVERLRHAMVAEDVVLGGGNVKKLKSLPPQVRQGSNRNAFLGGFRLWEQNATI